MSTLKSRIRRKKVEKLEQALIEIGYKKEYVDNEYNRNLRLLSRRDLDDRVDLPKLADEMNIDRRSFTIKFNDKKGMVKEFADEIINFLHKKHNIKLNIRL